MPRGLTLRKAHELRRGNAILQLQRDVQTLTISLAEVLVRFVDDPGRSRKRDRGLPRNDLTSYHFPHPKMNPHLGVEEDHLGTIKLT